jgi:hypothetical protein
MIFEGFVGGAGFAQSLDLDTEDLLNLYFDPGSPFSKGRAALLGTPGIAISQSVGAGPIRGLWAGEQRLFAASGSRLFEIFVDGAIDRGNIGNDNRPVIILPNGNQLGIISNGRFFCDNGLGPAPIQFPSQSGFVNTFLDGSAVWVSGDKFDAASIGQVILIGGLPYTVATVTDDEHLTVTTNPGIQVNTNYSFQEFVSASSGAFLDGYFIVARPGTKQFNISALNDGTTWSPLDFAAKEAYPDAIARVYADHEDLWLFGDQQSTEVWQNTGAANFPFQRIPGNFIHYGLAATFSVSRLSNGLAWIAMDTERGAPVAIYTQGFQPNRISTAAVENAWANYSTITDAISYDYIDRGHEFWVITFPTANATWAYDATVNLWGRRGFYNGATSDAQRQGCHAYVALAAHAITPALPARHYVGDRTTASIYTMSADLFTDAGTPIERIRTCPHISQEQKRNFYHLFQLDTELRDDAMTLSWSGDGGHTYNTPVTPSTTSSESSFLARTFWTRLGSSRDRTFRARTLSAIKIAWVQAYLQLTQGTS